MQYCKNCQNSDFGSTTRKPAGADLCIVNEITDPVTGEVSYLRCVEARADPVACGPLAIKFVDKNSPVP